MEKKIISLEDLIVSAVLIYVLDKKSKKPIFYKQDDLKGYGFKEYCYKMLGKKGIELDSEYIDYDAVTTYFEKMVSGYIEKYKSIDNINVIMFLSRDVKDDLRFFLSSKVNNELVLTKVEIG